MRRFNPSHWRGRGHGRQPRRVASLDSLLMIDQGDSILSAQSESLELHENTGVTGESSDHNTSEGHSMTQSQRQGEEFQRGNVSQPGLNSSKPLLDIVKPKVNRLRDWAPEIIALVSAICCLAAIYIVLVKFHNQQQPSWPYARNLNLSTLIALIATILRSMLEVVLSSGLGQLKWHWFRSEPRPLSHVQTFDDASRGPWGSLVFMCSLARFNLATFGSIIMVLSVVIGTVTQQAIQTVPCQKSSSNGKASVPIAQTCLKGVEATSLNTHLLTKDLKASLIAGLSGMRQPNSLSPTCPSGNCALQASDGLSYSTVGLSSECIDISALVLQSEVKPGAWISDDTPMTTSPAPMTNYTLPNGLTLSYILIPGTQSHGSNDDSRWSTMLAQAQLTQGELWLPNITMTRRQKHIVFESPWVDGILFLMPTVNPCQNPSDYYKYFDGNERFPMPATKANLCPELYLPGVDTLPGYFSVTAAACFFYPSLHQYESLIVNGALEEKALQDSIPITSTIHSEPMTEETSCFFCTIVDPCVIDHVVYTNTSANLSSVPGGITVLGNTTAPLRCLYGFTYPWYRALMVASELWKMIGSSAEENYCVQLGNYTSMVCSRTWWLNGIFNDGNASIASISEFMERGFDSLSAQLRMIGTDWDGNPTNAFGIAYDTAVCVLFRWEWLFYPLALAVASSILLLLLLASRSGTPGTKNDVIWKSSVLPFLFYGLEDPCRNQASKLAPQEEMIGVAKTLKTNFSPGDDGWRFHTGNK